MTFHREECQHTTRGLALLGLDGIIISFCSLLYFSFGLTFFNLAFSCYLQLQFFNWASVPGGRFSNPPTTPSPVRYMPPYCDRTQRSTYIFFGVYCDKFFKSISGFRFAVGRQNAGQKLKISFRLDKKLLGALLIFTRFRTT